MNTSRALERIYDSEVSTDPYPHLVVDNLFTAEDYADILADIPPDDEWHNFPDPTTRRRRWQTQTYTFDPWPSPLLARASAFFESDRVLVALRRKFGYAAYHPKGISKVVWCRDYDAFSISPHIDQKEKVFSFLFYLARNERNKQNGTQLLRPQGFYLRDRDANQMKGTAPDDHRQWYDFEKVKDVAFIPNRFVCWNVNASSYHSVDVRFRHDDPYPYRDTVRGFFFSDRDKLPHLFQGSTSALTEEAEADQRRVDAEDLMKDERYHHRE